MSRPDRGHVAASIADAVRAVPGVAHLTEGTRVRAATHIPGGTVAGVLLGAQRIEVHVAVDRLPVQPVAAAVHAATRAALTAAGSEQVPVVHVCVDDVLDSASVERPRMRPDNVRLARVRVAGGGQ